MKTLSKSLRLQCQMLRKGGYSHKDIARKLSIASATVRKYTKDISLNYLQKKALNRRTWRRSTVAQKHITAAMRRAWGRQGGQWVKTYLTKYQQKNLLKMIKEFVNKYQRLPVKREFPQYWTIRRKFGTWNKAIEAAGF